MPWPTEIKLKQSENTLHIAYDNGKAFVLPAYLLRVESPSAETQGHGGVKPVQHIDENVRLTHAEAVGNYAIRLHFSDGHSTGIYTWEYLYGLGEKEK